MVFVTLSVETSKTEWLKALEKFKPKGIHLWIECGMNNVFFKAYNINSLPRYVILDRNGKVNIVNAPKPSDTEMLEKIFVNF